MTRPRLTSKVVRGIRQSCSCISINLENGPAGGFQSCTNAELTDVDAALSYLYALATWHENQNAARDEAGAPIECNRCGKPVPRRRGTGHVFCSKQCERDQAREDRESMLSELADQRRKTP